MRSVRPVFAVTFALGATLGATIGGVGCHGTDVVAPDGTQSGGDASAAKGVIVPWQTTPATFPGNVSDNGDITVSSISMTVDTFEAIGDAGGGSSTRASLVLAWGADGSVPDAVALPAAPPGLYSKLSLHVDGNLIADSYEIFGTAKVNGTVTPYHIHDRDELSISIDVSGTLEPGASLTIPVAIDFARALRTVDYDSLDVDDGMLDLDTSDSQMEAFRDQLRDSFYEPDPH